MTNLVLPLTSSLISLTTLFVQMKTSDSEKWCIGDLGEYCEEVFCGAKGVDRTHYVVTSHQLLGLDVRHGFNQRWTHGVTQSPAFISVSSLGNGYTFFKCKHVIIVNYRGYMWGGGWLAIVQQ